MTSTIVNGLALRLRRAPKSPIASAVSLALLGLPAAHAQNTPGAQAGNSESPAPEEIDRKSVV